MDVPENCFSLPEIEILAFGIITFNCFFSVVTFGFGEILAAEEFSFQTKRREESPSLGSFCTAAFFH